MFKQLAFAAAATIATAGAASASNYILDLDASAERGSLIELETVRADMAGTIEIYDFHRGEQGALLASEMVNAGANSDVRINTGAQVINDVLAVLVVDGQVVDTLEIEVE